MSPTPVEKFRQFLKSHNLNGFIVPRNDEFQGEYVPAHAERLAWLTGFTGSAGMAILCQDQAALFVDGRYTVQANQEVDQKIFTLNHLIDYPPSQWIKDKLSAGFRLGYDPWLHTSDSLDKFTEVCQSQGIVLVQCLKNPIDEIWTDRPLASTEPFIPHETRYAGQSSLEKRQKIAHLLQKKSCQSLMITNPDSLAWLLNMRGNDVPFFPAPLCYGLLHDTGKFDLFVDHKRINSPLKSHLGPDIQLLDPDRMPDHLSGLKGKSLWLDLTSAASWFRDFMSQHEISIINDKDPCQLAKACKNDIEIDGAREAHRQDGIALTKFLAWLSTHVHHQAIDELMVAEKLLDYRAQSKDFLQPSFPTIAGSGSHAAICHYRATEKSNRILGQNEIFLLDSGGQYHQGTTDVTRTIAIGKVPESVKLHFTLVLKGHIALASLLFPEDTSGTQIDSFARHALWQEGLDYDHGTGHGVGSNLSVHEGPQRISKKSPYHQALLPGMIISNEPGYYKNGHYGIRIENLVVVKRSSKKGDIPLLEFETLTLAPIDQSLILVDKLTSTEKTWLNSYHQKVRETLTPSLDPQTAAWLKEATAEL
jgi:Xaa-Pro aminopeptidase